ncbi:hypothetical protein LCM4576_29215 [Mesorhizobium sp. LCM 4576]|uniref:hypothetical protein n=1 Tax=Mesorhizobium sp. LCM 4576 TaxID=1848289 RepID=UPI00090FE393|nr:hypothetical protein [Mesorhizobium sp. LCM 4576]OHV64251.1 hypothetical protein LCM4576_29215 [Mesorhizobium sp. LCM 4576]
MGELKLDPEIRDRVAETAKVLEGMGHVIEEIDAKNLGEALRLALARHRKAVSAAGKAMRAETTLETSPKFDGLRPVAPKPAQ